MSPAKAKPRTWYLTRGTVMTSKGRVDIVVATGPLPTENERIIVQEAGDASNGVPNEGDEILLRSARLKVKQK